MELKANEHQAQKNRSGMPADDIELAPRVERGLELLSHTATGSRYSPKTARKTPHISPSVA